MSSPRLQKILRHIEEELKFILLEEMPERDHQILAVHLLKIGRIKLIDAYILWKELLKRKPAQIVEVGSYMGFSTAFFFETTRAWRPQIISIDPFPSENLWGKQEAVYSKFLKKRFDRITTIKDYFSEHMLESVKKCLQPSQSTFFFIDGDHSYEAVCRDTQLALNLAKAGDVICYHDVLSWPTVGKAFRDSLENKGEIPLRTFHYPINLTRKLLGGRSHGTSAAPKAESPALDFIREHLSWAYQVWFDGVGIYEVRRKAA